MISVLNAQMALLLNGWDANSPYPNPENASAKMWTAWEPNPSEQYVKQTRKNSKHSWPKRWKDPVKAMEAIDILFP